MAARDGKGKSVKSRTAGGKQDKSKFEKFASFLYSRAPAEDLQLYDKTVLESCARQAFDAIMRRQVGGSVTVIDSGDSTRGAGRALTVITLINDNMPFLFDSLVGEITESAGEPTLVLHPVIHVRHGKSGSQNVIREAVSGKVGADADRVSLIQVHVDRLSAQAEEGLKQRLDEIMGHVRSAVAGWKQMLARLEMAIADYRYTPPPLKKETVDEAVEFLEWLRDDNFTFLGMREYVYSGGAKSGTLKRTDKAGLGILSNSAVRVLRSGKGGVTTTPEIRAFLNGPDPLIVTKANTKSNVHRRGYMDYVGVKMFDEKGKVSGELRIVGLFTSTAYTRSVARIPYLRSKADAVISKLGFDPSDHSGKSLLNVLESYPRDELFQIDVPTLTKHAVSIMMLSERPRVRALPRIDPFDRFVSVIVFVPRDRYDTASRERIGAYLKTVYDGRLSAFYPAFPEGALARVHFIIGRSGGKAPKVSVKRLESEIRQIVRTWDDALRDSASQNDLSPELVAVASRLPEAYRGSFGADEALEDAQQIAGLSTDNPIAVNFYRRDDVVLDRAALKIFHFGAPVALSRRVPLLENMGFHVISEQTFEVGGNGETSVFLHDMELENAFRQPIDLADAGAIFEQAFLAVWRGEVDNDRYNALVQTARLPAGSIVILRAYCRYLQQAGIPYDQDFIAGVLNRYPAIANDLFSLFNLRFDPARNSGKSTDADSRKIERSIETALQEVPSLDDDRVFRRLRNLVKSTLRTNAFAPPSEMPRSLAFKLDPRSIEGLPEPRPWREIFVYGAEVEGVHLRFGPVARGGLRWSDRALDYRTEVLGLVKAQQVKNAVIVPVGSKGGFYPKKLPADGGRDVIYEAGRQAYINFISSLLSITDNLDGDRVVSPKKVVRHDGDDPYFVVAADKGTAAFSDTANGVSQAYGFWLDDAFASGGSVGYDHKKMGITARGAWEAAKRHFREMNIDIQSQPFSVVGVGDMSGDVFGNGMLLSQQIRLIAAFDHRDIFIDPDPDVAGSFKERKRLFDMGRSSWQDYNTKLISNGGGVFPRSQKSITLSKAAASAIGLTKTVLTPVEIMRAIVKADADLLWFGGIGTYIRATSESDLDAGDRANDSIRVTAPEVRAKVIGEGANLGVTQKARIEFGLNGGKCNSDAIDNSAGVNSSDVEVNIKIALAQAMRSEKLKRPARDRFLAAMTDEVAELVLRNNYLQTLAISLMRRRGLADQPHQSRLMTDLESRGLLDRKVEDLPDETLLAEREARGEAMPRAEVGVLLSYAKIVLFDELMASDLPDDPHLESDLTGYFPDRMASRYKDEIRSHRLRREIIATLIGNDAINRGGPTFINRLQDLTGARSADIVKAFLVVRDGFELPAVYAEIDALDNKMDGLAQNGFYADVGRLVHSATAWVLKNGDRSAGLSESVTQLRSARGRLESKMPSLFPDFMKDSLQSRAKAAQDAGAPAALAKRLAGMATAELIPDIALVATHAGSDLLVAAKAYFSVTETFRIGRIQEAANAIAVTDYYDALALTRANDTIAHARRSIAVSALREHGKAADSIAAWVDADRTRIDNTRDRLQALVDGGDFSVSRLAVTAGLMTDLVNK